MFNISGFFNRVTGSFAKEVVIRSAICDALKEITGIQVPIESVSFKSGTVVLSGINQSQKSAIFIKKQAILKRIGEMQGYRTIVNIQ